MTVWLVCWLPEVGEEIPSCIFTSMEAAQAFVAARNVVGHWAITAFTLDKPDPDFD